MNRAKANKLICMQHLVRLRGSALVTALVLSGLIILMVMVSHQSVMFQTRMAGRSFRFQQALSVAEGGIEEAIWQIRLGEKDWSDWVVNENERTYSRQAINIVDHEGEVVGQYDVSIRDYPGQNPHIIATGYVPDKISEGGSHRTVRVNLNFAHPLYYYAIFGGNSTKDPKYVMDFGGGRATADAVNGDVYSNGNVAVGGRARINGEIHATGLIDGADGETGYDLYQPPDLARMNYESIADVNVAGAFSDPENLVTLNNSGIETRVSPAMNRSVVSVVENHPAHIFAKDVLNDFGPVDDGAPTTNENYFLGDWHASADGEDISVAADGNDLLYFVDGNLWIETNGYGPNLTAGPDSGIQITVVVKGNIYFADKLLYEDATKDGIAFIAIKDGEAFTDYGNGRYDSWEDYDDQNGNRRWDVGEDYEDTADWRFTPGTDSFADANNNGVYDGNNENSGNIYFGDPNTGPVGEVHSFLFAENNYVDCNINAQRTPQDFTINGNMTAGNHLRIKRDYITRQGRWWDSSYVEHTQMQVNYDSRLEDGTLTLPGLPKGDSEIYSGVFNWMER